MLNRILLSLFLFLANFGHAIDRGKECEKLLLEGEFDLVIQWLEPYVESGNCTKFDYSFLISAYMLKEDYINALAYSNKWYNISLEKKDTSNLINATSYKTDILYFAGDLDESIASINTALKYYRKSDSARAAVSNLRLAVSQREKGNLDLSYDIFTKIKFENIALEECEAEYFINFGVVYREMGMKDSAISNQKQSLRYSTGFEMGYFRAHAYSNIAVTYAMFNDPDLAFTYLDSAGMITLDKHHRIYKMVYKNYLMTYSELGMTDSALVYMNKLEELNQSLFLEKMDLEIKELEDQYEKEYNLKTKIVRSDEELERSKLQFLLSIIIILLIVIIAASAILLLRFKNLKVSRDNLLTTQRLLRSQITPHFLYNSLSTIQGMILNEEKNKASNYLSKFSRLVRLILNNSRDKVVSLSDELEAIKYYLDLQNARFSEMLEYTIRLADDLESKSLLIPPMLIQPFVENCIEHGFKNQDRKGEIDIHVYFKNKSLFCIITDNGAGVDASPPETIMPKKESISTGITAERMKLLAKEFKSKASLEIIDRKKYNEQGTIVTLEIPYKHD